MLRKGRRDKRQEGWQSRPGQGDEPECDGVGEHGLAGATHLSSATQQAFSDTSPQCERDVQKTRVFDVVQSLLGQELS